MQNSPEHHALGDPLEDASQDEGLGNDGACKADPQQLCARCEALDMSDLLQRQQAAAFDEEIVVWEWNDYDAPDWLKQECAFCRLVSIIKGPHDRSQAMHWYFSPPDFLYALGTIRSGPPVPLGLRKVVTRKSQEASSSIWRDASGRTRRNWTLFLASRSSVQNQGDLTIRSIKAETIDFNIVKTWLAQDKLQRKTRRVSQNFPDRLIDCHRKEVVHATGQPYVALSYVWGEALHGYPDVDKGVLPSLVSATVMDAISTTQALGYRFLWVDKYCIDQADPVARLRQINNMDIIFKRAEVTIVAASGQTGEFGLPGVSTRPRRVQLRARLNGANLIIVPSTKVIQEQIRQSKWNTRAWTFQEAHLSPRLLIFTETELYFESVNGNMRETVEAPFSCLDANIFLYQKSVFDPWNANNPEFINEAIAEFTARDLSREQDVLIAALGFLKEFQNSPNPVYHHWGLPIFPDQAIRLGHGRKTFPWLGTRPHEPFTHEGFLLGLCWRPAGDNLIGNDGMIPQRRPWFPSWSWSGWSCPLDKEPQTIYELRQFHAHFKDEVFIELLDGSRLPLKKLYELTHLTDEDTNFSPFIHLNVNTIRLSLVELKHDDMTPSMRERHSEPFALNFAGTLFPFCFGGWGSRTDSFISLVTPQELQRNLSGTSNPDALQGLLIGRFEDSEKRDWPYGMQYILVAVECNGYYERVGYIRQGDRRVDLEFRTLLEKSIMRRCVKLG